MSEQHKFSGDPSLSRQDEKVSLGELKKTARDQLRLSEVLGNVEPVDREEILESLLNDAIGASLQLQIPSRVEFGLLGEEHPNYAMGGPLRNEQGEIIGSKVYFNPKIIAAIGEISKFPLFPKKIMKAVATNALGMLVAHELYHTREALLFPKRSQKPEGAQTKYGRNEHAADLFAFDFINTKKPKSAAEYIGKTLVCMDKLALLRRVRNGEIPSEAIISR